MALVGLKVVEFAGLAPGPFTGLVLADNGADVTRVDRPFSESSSVDVLCRGKRSIVINSKVEPGRKLLEEMISSADVLIDPFRPGVLERLGLGPGLFLGDGKTRGLNERLIYARIVGFPKSGLYKDMAGHDINYLAVSGILSMLPGKEKPYFPLNLVADFAGGAMMCVIGILLALIERGRTGRGQVVDVDLVSGTRYLSSFPLIISHFRTPLFHGPRGTNLLDGGAPFYNTYTCKDGRWMSVGCIEPHFFRIFLEVFMKALPHDFDPCQGWKPEPSTQFNQQEWSKLAEYLSKGFLTQSRDIWSKIFLGTDACALPVLSPEEADHESSCIPLPHPQLSSATKPMHRAVPIINAGAHTNEVLRDLGVGKERLQKLREQGVFGGTFRHKTKL